MRPIDGDALIVAIERMMKHQIDTNDICEMIQNFTPIEPERKKGKWIRHPEQKNIFGGKTIECSECGARLLVQYVEDEKYCRSCGVKMEEGEQE